MLNISENSINHLLPEKYRTVIRKESLPRAHRMLRWWLFGVLVFSMVVLFLPWRQNIRAKGNVTTLSPDQRPQTINATISGRIEKWYVREGELVKKGDTIVFLSEIKTEYFDPGLIERTGNQVVAKRGAINAYEQKADALGDQISAMQQELVLKRSQLAAKIEQVRLKLASQRADLEQALVSRDIAEAQMVRTDTLFRKDIKSRTDLENKRQKFQEEQAKAVAARNKVEEVENELEVARLEFANIINEYNNKIAKAMADQSSTISDRFTAEGDLNKKEIEYQNYQRRSDFYYILAPQDCYMTQVIRPGVGEIIKDGEPLVSIMPANFDLAVEIFVRPMDLPLIQAGQEVRFLFDGWPAIFFSGWPDLSYGVYSGEVVAIDNTPSKGGNYRILVSPESSQREWPDALRPGSGAQGIALLNQVPVWYELWRQLNGFPADFYDDVTTTPGGKGASAGTGNEKSDEEPKLKAPLKSVK